MKLLALSALICALMALTLAADSAEPEPQPEPKSELQEAQAVPADVEKKTFCWPWSGWTLIGHRYFLYIPHCLTWHQAERKCISLGGHLASVHSGWEYQQIRNLIARHNRHHPRAWIGGTDQHCEGHWKWSDGSCFNYKGWCCGEPNNQGNEDCLEINFSGHKCWNDLHCNHRLPSVCVRNRKW